MDNIKLFENGKELKIIYTNSENIQTGYKNGNWLWKMRYANNEKTKKTNNRMTRTTKSRKNQNARRLSIIDKLDASICGLKDYNRAKRCPGCYCCRRRNWTRQHEFKSWTDCISHSTNTLGKRLNPIILPPAMGK